MKDPLVRFGVAIEESLLGDLDALVEQRGCTRSELLRDLARGEVGRARVPEGVDAVGTLTLVYDHHVRDLGEKLTDLQHQLGEGVRASMHVHLTHDLCLEVVVMRGKSDRLRIIADRILAMRGVKHGGIEIVTGIGQPAHSHPHGHGHGHEHTPPPEPEPKDSPRRKLRPAPTRATGPSPKPRRAARGRNDAPGAPSK
jgi:CopG family nickel-responsive transcriptional regulator